MSDKRLNYIGNCRVFIRAQCAEFDELNYEFFLAAMEEAKRNFYDGGANQDWRKDCYNTIRNYIGI